MSRLGVKWRSFTPTMTRSTEDPATDQGHPDTTLRTDAIIVEPVGTEIDSGGQGRRRGRHRWGILNREYGTYFRLRRGQRAPVFSVAADQVGVGRLQGRAVCSLAAQGDVLYIEGPSGGGDAAALRTRGMLWVSPRGSN